MQSLKSPYILYNQQSVGSTLHNNLLFITYSFLQIPPHDGHPCCSAIHFPLPGHVQDFHLRERAHGTQTKRAPQGAQKSWCLADFLSKHQLQKLIHSNFYHNNLKTLHRIQILVLN